MIRRTVKVNTATVIPLFSISNNRRSCIPQTHNENNFAGFGVLDGEKIMIFSEK
jgi:hypothetical protein